MEINIDNYSKLKENKLSRADIANQFGIPEWKLKRIISQNGWGAKRPIFTNSCAFSTYTEEACYWAGFLAADGCIDSKNRVRVMLKYDDIGHLEKLKKFLGSSHKISSNTDTYNRASFELTSSKLCDDLGTNFNIIPNKTSIMEFPKQVPESMVKHYIRGYSDGDGSICESLSNKNSVTKSLYATFCSGSSEYAEHLFRLLSSLLHLGGSLQDFRPTYNKHQLKYNTNDTKTLLRWLYADSIVYLDRKFLLYDTIVVKNIRQTR